jgi:hypothetical protein
MTKTLCALFAVAILSAAVPAVAGNMGADEARRFVVGNLFSFTCFEGTVANVVYHAASKRVRDLPITTDKLTRH